MKVNETQQQNETRLYQAVQPNINQLLYNRRELQTSLSLVPERTADKLELPSLRL